MLIDSIIKIIQLQIKNDLADKAARALVAQGIVVVVPRGRFTENECTESLCGSKYICVAPLRYDECTCGKTHRS